MLLLICDSEDTGETDWESSGPASWGDHKGLDDDVSGGGDSDEIDNEAAEALGLDVKLARDGQLADSLRMSEQEPDDLTLEECLELVARYQRTDNRRVFLLLLAKFDLLILSVIHRMRKRHRCLRREEMQALYHVGIIGFAAALKKLPEDEEPRKIPAWIVAYVKAELRRDYVGVEVRYRQMIDRAAHRLIERRKQRFSREVPISQAAIDAKSVLMAPVLSDLQRDLIYSYVVEGQTRVELAARYGMKQDSLVGQIRRGIEKLKKYMKL